MAQSPPKKITLTERELKQRENEIRKLISVLASEPLAAHRITSSSRYTITLHKGARQGQQSRDPRDYIFKTYSPNFIAQYLEYWNKNTTDKEETYYLHTIMLNMFRVMPNHDTPREFFNLHCEPTFIQTIETYREETVFTRRRKKYLSLQERYKRLHIHLSEAEEPIKHAHIAIKLGQEDQILQNTQTLNDALEEILQMIRNELLEAEFCNLKHLDTVIIE